MKTFRFFSLPSMICLLLGLSLTAASAALPDPALEQVQILSQLSADAEPLIAKRALAALSKVPHPSATNALAHLHAKPGALETYRIEHAWLAQLERRWSAGEDRKLQTELKQLIATAKDPQVQLAAWGLQFRYAEDPAAVLEQRLQHGDPWVRRDAIRRVDELPEDFRRGDQLLRLVAADPEATLQLLHFLVSRRDPSILPMLREGIDSEVSELRDFALRSMRFYATPEDLPLLLRWVSASDKTASEFARESIVRAPGEALSEAMFAAAAQADLETAKILIDLIAERGLRSHRGRLLQVGQARGPELHAHAILAWAALAEDADLEALLRHLDAVDSSEVIDAGLRALTRLQRMSSDPEGLQQQMGKLLPTLKSGTLKAKLQP